LQTDPNEFPRDVMEVIDYFREPQAGQQVRAVPGGGLRVPVWILGSSLFGAQVAAALGLPFAFASHFAPQMMNDAVAIYRERFTPSEHSQKPYVMLGVNVVAADSDAEARFLASSGRQSFASLRAGGPIPLPPPSKEWERDPADRSDMSNQTRVSFVGAPDTIRMQMKEFADTSGADELIVVAHIYDHRARLRSYELAKEIWDQVAA
jgi:luciferase family oxidoreductase group 1